MYQTTETLMAGLEAIRQAPKDDGKLEMIVIRPSENARELPGTCEVHAAEGVCGDNWRQRRKKYLPDGSLDPDSQIAIMSSRAIELIAGGRERWPLAGDNLMVDFDLSDENLQPGQKLEIGTALLEITAEAHNGCAKFAERFGREALKVVNSPEGKQLHLRGIYAKVVRAGSLKTGDLIRKVS